MSSELHLLELKQNLDSELKGSILALNCTCWNWNARGRAQRRAKPRSELHLLELKPIKAVTTIALDQSLNCTCWNWNFQHKATPGFLHALWIAPVGIETYGVLRYADLSAVSELHLLELKRFLIIIRQRQNPYRYGGCDIPTLKRYWEYWR